MHTNYNAEINDFSKLYEKITTTQKRICKDLSFLLSTRFAGFTFFKVFTFLIFTYKFKRLALHCKSTIKRLTNLMHSKGINDATISEIFELGMELRESLTEFKEDIAKCDFVRWPQKLDDILIDLDDLVEECTMSTDSEMRDLVSKLHQAL